MANIKDLKKYVGYEFSSGCYTGDDYKSFQTKYINFLKTMCRNNHWQLVNVGRNHYCFSAFIKSAENKCVYVSISDVRYFSDEWYNHILIRTARKTKRTTAVGSTTIRRSTVWKVRLANCLTTYRFKEIRK